MKRQSISTWLGLLATAAVCGVVSAATPDSPETWGSGTAQGWMRADPLNATSLAASNPTNYLQAVFGAQSQPFPEVNIIRADVTASGGAFAGNYWVAAVTNVDFKLLCGTHQPGALHLCFYSASSGNWWYYPLAASPVGTWTDYSVPVEYGTGWWTGSGAGSVAFRKDRENVTWIGVRVQRNSSIAAQGYGLDDFVLRGASRLKDADDDGASDWHEFMAGTDPGNSDSRFALEMHGVKTNRAKGLGIVLRWTSAPDRTYTIRRSTDLTKGFTPVEIGIPGRPPMNEHEDSTATNSVPYFYQVGVE